LHRTPKYCPRRTTALSNRIDLARETHLLNNVPATSAEVLEDSELIDCLLARVRELRPDLDVENVAETLKFASR
jgi:hypothetical protein